MHVWKKGVVERKRKKKKLADTDKLPLFLESAIEIYCEVGECVCVCVCGGGVMCKGQHCEITFGGRAECILKVYQTRGIGINIEHIM